MVVLLLLALLSLLIDNRVEGLFNLPEYLLLALGLVLLLAGGALTLLEPYPARPRQSRGMQAAMTGAVLLIFTLALPVIAARAALPGQISRLPTATPGPTRTMNEVALDVYEQVLNAIASETGYDLATISDRLDQGDASVAAMVRETGGSLETVIQEITSIMSAEVQMLAAQDRMDPGQAAFAISAMETLVRAGVEFDLEGLMQRFEPTATPGG
ncbi:MAG: hypothetical protein ACOCXR_01620 [Phototrophicaceae bacterium]